MSMTDLEARMNRMEAMMEQLLAILSTSDFDMQKLKRMQALLDELHHGGSTYASDMTGVNLPAVAPPARPLNKSIQDALLARNNLKAIKLYRELYNVTMQEAADALKITLR